MLKKILLWFIAYYLLGIVAINAFTFSRFSGSVNLLEVGPGLVVQNMTTPYFYAATLVWPWIIGNFIFKIVTGNIG